MCQIKQYNFISLILIKVDIFVYRRVRNLNANCQSSTFTRCKSYYYFGKKENYKMSIHARWQSQKYILRNSKYHIRDIMAWSKTVEVKNVHVNLVAEVTRGYRLLQFWVCPKRGQTQNSNSHVLLPQKLYLT